MSDIKDSHYNGRNWNEPVKQSTDEERAARKARRLEIEAEIVAARSLMTTEDALELVTLIEGTQYIIGELIELSNVGFKTDDIKTIIKTGVKADYVISLRGALPSNLADLARLKKLAPARNRRYVEPRVCATCKYCVFIEVASYCLRDDEKISYGDRQEYYTTCNLWRARNLTRE